MKKIKWIKRRDKEQEEGLDPSFFRAQKLKKRIKRKGMLVNVLFVFVVFVSIISLGKMNEEKEIQGNEQTKLFLEEYIENYYTFPTTDESKNYVSLFSTIPMMNYSENLIAVQVEKIEFNDVQSEYLKRGIIKSSYNMIITLSMDYGVDQEENHRIEKKEIVRTFDVIEGRNEKRYAVVRLQPTTIAISAISDKTTYTYLPKVAMTTLADGERASAETKVNLFLNQYNDSWDKAVDLVSDPTVLAYKSPDITYTFESIVSSTKEKDNSVWYIQSKIRVGNEDYREFKTLELHINQKNGKIEKVEVY